MARHRHANAPRSAEASKALAGLGIYGVRVERQVGALGALHVVVCTLCGHGIASVAGSLSSSMPEAIAAEWRSSYEQHRGSCSSQLAG